MALLEGPGSPACETYSLARYISQCIRDGDETADERPGIDGVVIDGDCLLDNRCWGCPRRNSGIRGS
jgi:hypothetical protein